MTLLAWQTAQLMNATGNFQKKPVRISDLASQLLGHPVKETRSAEELRRDWEELKNDFARGRKTKPRKRGAVR